MVVRKATAGAKGADVNQILSAQDCKVFVENGETFLIRYIPRTPELIAGNITASEIQTILTSGLGLSIVQHCPRPNWDPSAELGELYGGYASGYCKSIGLPSGMVIWLDLEEVSSAATPEEVMEYCNAWYAKVSEGNYIPGLYVGYAPGLTSELLYKNLGFRNYWRAYNYDDGVETRGFQLIQHSQQSLNGIKFDPNTVQADEFGDLPMFLFQS